MTQNSIGDYNLGLPGQYWDQEKNSWYNYFRDYDASIGRYLQSDPVGLNGGVNTFGYVLNNPTKYIDQFGLKGTPCDCEGKPVQLWTANSHIIKSDEAVDLNAAFSRQANFGNNILVTIVGIGVSAYTGGVAYPAAVAFSSSFILNEVNTGVTTRAGYKYITRVYQHDSGSGWAMNKKIIDREENTVWSDWITPRCE